MNENRATNDPEKYGAENNLNTAKPAEASVASPDRHPNLTLLESGQNPGELLKSAREKMGLSLSDISVQTKINERQLRAIESGIVEKLPPETFAKAFIKSYCKVVRLEAGPVLRAFGFEATAAGTATPSASADPNRGEPKMPSSSRRLSSLSFDRKPVKRRLGLMIVLAALVVLAVFYIPVFMEGHGDKTASQPVASLPANVEPVPQAPVNSEPVPIGQAVLPGVESSAATTAPAASAPAPASVGNPVFPAIQAENQKSAQAAAAAQAPASPAPVAPAASEADTSTKSAKLAVPASAQGDTTTVAGVGKPDSNLKFSFDDQSWVTVRDANDKVLLSQMNSPGSTMQVRGQAPFKVIVGNAKTVKLTMNGKPVDLTSSIRGEVARLTLE
ncbi:RodZ domain-containing protein [Limnobacter sp.]|uniref:RodZ domain-containing protein n=1 Tax=Limnobacter sp. TaxID=2003368 RepID=UPI00258DF386|nr:RodZ domain-containing protein [Limnobacter sp.]